MKFGEEKNCGTCNNFERSESNGRGKCFRNKNHPIERWANDPICDYLKYTPKKDRFHHSGCFITTAVVTMLGYADNSVELENLRSLRTFMTTSEEGNALLATYDIVGPQIANKLMDTNDITVAEELFTYYIEPCSLLIEDGDFEKAQYQYEEMIIKLVEHYNIDNEVPKSIVDHYMSKTKEPGHGKIKLMPKSTNS